MRRLAGPFGLRVAHVGFHRDPQRRPPAQLVEAWSTLRDVAAAAARAQVEVHVFQPACDDGVLDQDGVSYHFVRSGPARPGIGWSERLHRPRRLTECVRAVRPDVVHVGGLGYPIQIHYLTRALRGVPVLAQDHAERPRSGLWSVVQRVGLVSLAGVAFTAREQAEPFIAAGILRPDIPVFEVLESSTHFSPGDQATACSRTGLRGDPCLLWLGRLDSNKDPLTVLDALSRAVEALPDAHLWMCFGAAPLREAVQRRVVGDGRLRGRVHLLGERRHDDVEHLLRAADFLVQGSHREGSGYAVIEALACGTTPLVTDIPSFRKITANGAVGALSPPGDLDAMARALIDWSRRDRRALRVAARAHFERELSFDAIGRQLKRAYEALAGQR